jgi:hypothetical protein
MSAFNVSVYRAVPRPLWSGALRCFTERGREAVAMIVKESPTDRTDRKIGGASTSVMTPSWSSSTSRSSPIHSVSKLFSNGGLALRLVPRMGELVEENQTGSSEGDTFTTTPARRTCSWLDERCMPIVLRQGWSRAFDKCYVWPILWCGMDIALRGQCMVAWKIACALKSSVMSWRIENATIPGIRVLGYALRLSWEWQHLPEKAEKIVKSMGQASMSVVIGEGASAKFWLDSWLSSGLISAFATNLFRAISRQPRNWTATRRTPFPSNTQRHVGYHFFSRSMDKN